MGHPTCWHKTCQNGTGFEAQPEFAGGHFRNVWYGGGSMKKSRSECGVSDQMKVGRKEKRGKRSSKE